MKKTFFFLAMLISVAASATVAVTPLGVDYAAQKVTFKVAWTGSAYNNRVWVWIDLCPVPGVTPGAFQNAVISAASATGGSVLYASTNTRGFFVTTNPSTVTATLDNASGKFNWCAYGSDAPPNVTAANGTYTFKGSPPFILTAANGTTAQTVAGKTLAASALTVTPVTLTDRTGYPNVFCIYTGSDLLIDATHSCQLRTSGAKNWEAYIKDSRDNNIYRIVQMPDNKWYTAQNQNYRGVTYYCYGNNAANCNETNGVLYPMTLYNAQICPLSWTIPTNTEWNAFITTNNITTSAQLLIAALNGNDQFGLSYVDAGYCVASGCYNKTNWDCQGLISLTAGWCVVIPYGLAAPYTQWLHSNHSVAATDRLPVRCMRN
jgi:uncharacterized protein (TIGR02145 family)